MGTTAAVRRPVADVADNMTERPMVAPLRMLEFRDYAEFSEYLKHSETLRADRWLYEQSLATLEDSLVLRGTCGLCLTEAAFVCSTRNGESAAGGRVPHWREELICDCRQRLCNRQRALLHYLLAADLLQPWTRVLALGDLGPLLARLDTLSDHLTTWPGAIDRLPQSDSHRVPEWHLTVSVEQFDAQILCPDVIASLAARLCDGGRLVFTAPFDVSLEPAGRPLAAGPVGWWILPALREHGFSDAKASMYWSEEFGYLGPFNFIFEASK